jgi:glycosyltransferase involved in cell wall biosynthesis
MTATDLIFLVSHSSAGGAQEIWANLADGFRARGARVKLCALYPLRAEVRETSADLPWTFVAPARPGSPLAQIGLVRALRAFLKENPASHLLSAMPAANVLGPLGARLAGVGTRCILSHHSPVQTHNPVLNAADSVVGCMGNVTAIVSVSQAVSASLDGKPAAYRAKRRTIYNALPDEVEQRLAALALARRSQPPGRRVVATGRLSEQKNYPTLLSAAALLPDVTFDIVGSGPDEAALKRMAMELGLGDRVRFHGQLSRPEALAILAAGDVFAQPSLYEGHSLGLLEAAKLGMPLVVSDAPTQIEGVTGPDGERCGLVAGTHDAEGLAGAMRLLLNDEGARAQWQAQAAALAANVTFDRLLDRYQALIDEARP